MTTRKRLNIGLMIHHLENEYATELLNGAIIAAEEYDVNLILLPGRGINAVNDDEKYSIYDYQYNVIYNYVSNKNLDALIVSAGTIGSYISREEMLGFLDSFHGLPILTLEVEYPGYPCIYFSAGGMRLAVEHLIKECGCHKIGYVSGPAGNPDAMTRLESYKNTLISHGMLPDESKIVYGNFSESSEDVVRHLLDAHPDLEAICFANDKMCIGGYNVFEERGLIPGKDIKVTGYDDSEVATSLKPMLTTVRTNVSDMGYHSVISAIDLARTGSTKTMAMDSRLIIRDSCGYVMAHEGTSTRLKKLALNMDVEKIVDIIFDKLIGDVENVKKTDFVRQCWHDIRALLAVVCSGKVPNKEEFCERIKDLFDSTTTIRVPISLIRKVMQYTVEVCLEVADNPDKIRNSVNEIYTFFIENLLDYAVQQQYVLKSNLVYSNFLISNINKDMMINCSDEEKSFFSIINNLYQVNFYSSYIYIYKNPIVHYQYEPWYMPEKIYLKSYHIGNRLQMIEPPNQEVDPYDCINNKFISKNRRYTFIMVPLFSNEEQYGLFICELDINHFSQIYSVAPQICSAIKMTHLVKELEGDLEEERYNNQQLERISDSDELTGAYNRRGYYRSSNGMLKMHPNKKYAIAMIADLDNLKIINDTFGHSAGDHALRTCVYYLNSCVPMLDIVGRIGGDEFAAFMLTDDPDEAVDEIYHSIKNLARQYNETSDVDYNITVSLGISCSPVEEITNVQSMISVADTKLYEDKKRKNRVVIKKRS